MQTIEQVNSVSTNRPPLNMSTAHVNSPYKVWIENEGRFSSHHIGALRHNFHEHPLMQLDKLARLAKDLAKTEQCRFIKPGTQQASAFHHVPSDPDGRDIDEVFRRMEEPGSWLALYNVETDPEYRDFLREVTDSARHLVDREQTGMFNVGGFIFISAPPSITPFHIDRENNFWLQVRGRKTMNVWDHRDRMVVAAEDVDDFIVYASLENVKLKDGFRERSHEFDVGVGDGVYFPSTSPHMTSCDTKWVKPGDGISISIGVVFYTDVTRRTANVHALNHVLRRLGLSPNPPGESLWLDRLKYPLGRATVWAKKTFRGYKPSMGL